MMSAKHPGVSYATIHIQVRGRPAPQGSKTRTRFAMRDANAAMLHPWRDAVRHEVAIVMQGTEPLDGPIGMSVTFTLPKPTSAPKLRRVWPIKARSGDLDKLLRAILDACTDGGLWGDDSQVVRFKDVSKVYVGDPEASATPGADITVWQLDG